MLNTINEFLWSAGGFVVVLGVLIFIHELGHFAVAKWLGIRVETFSLGFGPRIAGFRRGDTDYRISIIPLGGYVKMLGEMPDEELSGTKEEFQSRTKFERFLVLVMGPVVNLVFAYLLYVFVFMAGVSQPSYLEGPAILGEIAQDSSAAKAGLQSGDRILALDGVQVEDWEKLRLQILLNPETEPVFTIQRDDRTFDVPIFITAENKHRHGDIGVEPAMLVQVHEVVVGSPAERGGLQTGDLLLRGDGERFVWNSESTNLYDLVKSKAGQPMQLSILRGQEELDLEVTPDPVEGTIGIQPGPPIKTIQYGFAGAVVEAGRLIRQESLLLFQTLKKLVTGSLSMRALSGPVEIAKFSGVTASLGLIPFLRFMGMVSLQLGIINLFPIPVLDGGQILLLGAEGVARREFSPALKDKFMLVGLVMILALMAAVIYFDVVKLFSA